MFSVYKLKPVFQKLLQPILDALYKIGVTANQLTISAIILSCLMGFGFLRFHTLYLGILIIPFGLLLRMALNALDGMMARQYDMQSQLGEILNEIGDVVSDIAIIFPFVILPGINPVIIILFGVLAILNEFAGILSKAIGKERRYDGPMGKSDRALIIGIFCLVFFFWSDVTYYGDWIFGIASALVLVGTIIRLYKAL